MTHRRGLAALLALGLLLAACTDGGDDEVRSGAAPVAAVPALPDLAAQFAGAVYRVETEGCGWIGSGSGFAVDAHHLVTNHHVVANDSSPVVRAQDGTAVEGRVIGSTERPDLAVIELDEALPVTVAWADTDQLRRTEPLVVMGFPIPERTFKVTTGEVISFQPPDRREALIANNPIDKGNSGGPALRRDGTVAGVVTEMAVRDDDGQRVAIVFTAATVQPTVEAMIARPTEVLSSCGLGPDYVPDVPTDFDVPPAAERPAPPVQPDPADYAPAVPATTTTTTTTPCPAADEVGVTVDDATVAAGATEGTGVLRLSGTVVGAAGAPIEVTSLRVSVDGRSPVFATGAAGPTAAGAVRPWSVPDDTTVAAGTDRATLRLTWTWADPGLRRRCGAPAVEVEVSLASGPLPAPTTTLGSAPSGPVPPTVP